MKDLIIIVGTVVLGCLICSMICGDHHSLRQAAGKTMEKNLRTYQEMHQ